MIYLAIPYTHKSAKVRRYRYQLATHVAGEIMRTENVPVFSPITHSHPIAEAGGLPLTWEHYEEIDTAMIMACDEIVVLCSYGWNESTGVSAETEIAKKYGKGIRHMNPDCFGHEAVYLDRCIIGAMTVAEW